MAKKQTKQKTAASSASKLRDRTVVPAWECGVHNGKVVIKDRAAFDQHLIPFEGKDNLSLVLKRKVKPRSRPIEKYYRAVPVRMIAAEMGIEDEEVHEMLKAMFLKTEDSKELPDGKVIRYERVMSTTELGDKRYYEYVFDQVLPWGSKTVGIYIPLPNEADYDGAEYAHLINR